VEQLEGKAAQAKAKAIEEQEGSKMNEEVEEPELVEA
jgi:hypothetical protein